MEWGQQLRKAEPCPRPSRVLSAFKMMGRQICLVSGSMGMARVWYLPDARALPGHGNLCNPAQPQKIDMQKMTVFSLTPYKPLPTRKP